MPKLHEDSAEDTASREGHPFGTLMDTLAHPKVRPDLPAFGFAVLAVTGAVGVGLMLWPWIGLENISLVFLTAIVATAAGYGLWPSLFATVLSSLCYNFFFTAPYYTFSIDDPANIVAVVVFSIVAIIVSNVAARARVQAVTAMARARTTELLYAFSRKLAGTGTLDDVLWATAHQTALMLNVRVVLLLPENGTIAVKAGYPPEDELEEADLAAAHWAWQHNVVAGHGSDILTQAKRLFLPMRTGRGAIGVVGIDSDRDNPLPTAAERRLLEALIDQSALAIERVHLVEHMERVKRTFETERLRSALLTSISHDLKTPLAAVLGAAGTLRDLASKLNQDQKDELLATVIDESERLNRFIANLLDMTRLESGAIVPNTARHDLHEIVGSVLRRAGKILQPHRVELDLAGDLPMLELDAVLFEQVLFNLLDNASKYAPSGTTITIRSRRDRDDIIALDVMDEGDGISASELGQIFEKFYRARKGDRVRAGTGLGLAISRGFVEAMHGTISAANRSNRTGAIFTIRLPVPAAPQGMDEVA
jgi:two-component system, OmpR family, sensor histidine kinase KdpD